MYIAVTTRKKKPHFILRESCRIDNRLTSRDLMSLGADPSTFIKYPGGNAFYLDEKIEASLSKAGVAYDIDELEDLFWPWLEPDIRRAVDTFRGRGAARPQKLTETQKEMIRQQVSAFDKRRAHYLKFANMDQGPVENMPEVLFKNLVDCSRDEIEQKFLRQEYRLNARELKSYVYTVFNLQRHFQGFLAKKMPQALDQEKVDACFLEDLCRINDRLFSKKNRLDPYMIRYAVMFFDNPYAGTTLLDEFSRDFMFRHRFHRTVQKKTAVPVRSALKLFNLSKDDFKSVDKKHLTRLYRKLAGKAHPDRGGTHEQFIRLTEAFQALLEKIRLKK